VGRSVEAQNITISNLFGILILLCVSLFGFYWIRLRSLHPKLVTASVLIISAFWFAPIPYVLYDNYENARSNAKDLKSKASSEALVNTNDLQTKIDESLRRRRAEGGEWIVESVGLAMVSIAGGTFQMGGEGPYSKVGPITTVTLRAFWLGRTEVTQGQYRKIMGKYKSKAEGDTLPVDVSWLDAVAFCRKLTELERGRGDCQLGWSIRYLQMLSGSMLAVQVLRKISRKI
jgi:hypothetical protein